jgi:hypothetical protein
MLVNKKNLAAGSIFQALDEGYDVITGLLLCLSSIIFNPTYLFNINMHGFHVNSCYYNIANTIITLNIIHIAPDTATTNQVQSAIQILKDSI